ncbi:MAG TPA: tripartite tricarboxylate transporter substrate binding protein [Ramlibacter sp.]|nr:tripartite tricarboxylate transporter substrate binding protein [Ramlibacter sp.]
MKRRSSLQFLGLALAAAAGGALAQTASGRTLRLIVPNPAGTGTDHVARVLAPALGTALGQTVVIENKGGANGVIAMQDLMRSPPDGSTILLGSLSPLAINVALFKNLPYDPRRDITPVAGGYLSNQALLVKASHPARNFAEFIAHAKQNPGMVTIGHSTSLVQAQIKAMAKMAGVDVMLVPYKGVPATITDVIGGVLDATFVDMANALGQAKSGQIRVLAVTSGKRNPAAADWPSIGETVPGYDFSGWTAIVGPRGMSREAVGKINAALGTVLKQKDVQDKLAAIGMVPWQVTPDELKTLIETDIVKWTKLAAEHKIQAE